MLTFLLFLAVVGPLGGAAARLLVPGPDLMRIRATILLGTVGAGRVTT